MKPISTFRVIPSLPKALEPLKEIMYNFHWTWSADAFQLFRRMNPDLWEECNHNPVMMIGLMKQEDLEQLAQHPGFLAHLDRVYLRYNLYLTESTWYENIYGREDNPIYAYFSAEFGINEGLPIYSGGLGVLAGDHLKSASDLGLPMVAVGLAYQEGYFRQYLNADGWQQENFPVNNFYNMPMQLVRRGDSVPLLVEVEYPNGVVYAQVWRLEIGRVSLFLLDTNFPRNRKENREITARLYGGDREMRLRQEILLGIGGYRALKLMDYKPKVCHINEGHSAFLTLERIRQLMKEQKLQFYDAVEATACGNIFTTHTPVPAGNDVFDVGLIDKYFTDYARELGLSRNEFLDLGRGRGQGDDVGFNMTVLAIQLSAFRNGVSKLHGIISRKMWQYLWPQVPLNDIPIQSITNGVHVHSWISREMADLFIRYIGAGWNESPADHTVWEGIADIPDEELWRTHERRRERLVAFARKTLKAQLIERGASVHEIERAGEVLDPEILTIGFARRFATYKRATLILTDLERLNKILNNPEKPVQLIFAGKAHPADNQGKEFIRRIVHVASMEQFRNRIVFLEDYDINIARYLVQGVDIWLNNPRRPLEASGTSGMKASINGALNLSILDGWWDEAYQVGTGWAIDRREEYFDEQYQDHVQSRAIYNLLESDIVPLFYATGPDGLPRQWITRMKAAIQTFGPLFNTNRMVQDYLNLFYIKSKNMVQKFERDQFLRARELAKWKSYLDKHWKAIRIDKIKDVKSDELIVGSTLTVKAVIFLGDLKPEDVLVQIYYGVIESDDEIESAQTSPLKWVKEEEKGHHHYSGTVTFTQSGLLGYSVRILPHHPDLHSPYLCGKVKWAEVTA